MNLHPIQELTQAHYALLLSADPAKKLVTDYCQRGIVFEVLLTNQLVGICVLLPTRPETIEIVNIAVAAAYQNKGIGQKMIIFLCDYAKQNHYTTIEIGTGSTSFHQLYLYQKCGFRMQSIDHNFFINHYSHEIVENNLVLKDMVRLRKTL